MQCLTCKTRYVTEVLKLPTTVQMQVALVTGMRAMVAIILRAGDPASPLSRRRALDAVTGAGEGGYDEDALEEDLAEPADAARAKIGALGAQLQIEAREWCLAEAIRIAMADGPLTGAERAAAEHLAAALGMTQAQAIGVIALTEQNVPRGDDPPAPPAWGASPPMPPRGTRKRPPRVAGVKPWSVQACKRALAGLSWLLSAALLVMSHELLLLSGRGGGL